MNEVIDTYFNKRVEFVHWKEDGKDHYQIRYNCNLCKSYSTINGNSISELSNQIGIIFLTKAICENCHKKIKEMGYTKK